MMRDWRNLKGRSREPRDVEGLETLEGEATGARGGGGSRGESS